MGITSKKPRDLPDEVQPYHHPKKFETITAFDNSVRQPKTGIGVPTDEAVKELKTFMNINKQ
ncbi:MAG: hypothetical protein FWC32_13020 [Firmicutes bacterium]|nr:hypothetical protein [Bacillota bacterium]